MMTEKRESPIVLLAMNDLESREDSGRLALLAARGSARGRRPAIMVAAGLLFGVHGACQPGTTNPAESAHRPVDGRVGGGPKAGPGVERACTDNGLCASVWVELATPSMVCVGWIGPSLPDPQPAWGLTLGRGTLEHPSVQLTSMTATGTQTAGIRCGPHPGGEVSGRLEMPGGEAALQLAVGAPSVPDLPPEDWLWRRLSAALQGAGGEPIGTPSALPRASRSLQVRTRDQSSATVFLRPRGVCQGRLDRGSCHAALFAREDDSICANVADLAACRQSLEALSGWTGDPSYAVVLVPERGSLQILTAWQEISDQLGPCDTDGEALLYFAQHGGWEDAKVAPMPGGGRFVLGARRFAMLDGRAGAGAFGDHDSNHAGGCELPDYPPWHEPGLGRCEPIALPYGCNSIQGVAWSCPVGELPDLQGASPPGERGLAAKAFRSQAGEWQGGAVRQLKLDLQPHVAAGYLRAFGAEDVAICAQERAPLACRRTLAERGKSLSVQEGFRSDTWVLAGIVNQGSGRAATLDLIATLITQPDSELEAKLLAVRAMGIWTPSAWTAVRVPRGWLVEGPAEGAEPRAVLVQDGWGSAVDLRTCVSPPQLPETIVRAMTRLHLPSQTQACERPDGRWELRGPRGTQLFSP
jgi:hypothetical protein